MNNTDDMNDSIIENVWKYLDGQVSREQIGRVVAEVMLGFQDATVRAFVPIFVHREAVERLQSQLNENSLSVH